MIALSEEAKIRATVSLPTPGEPAGQYQARARRNFCYGERAGRSLTFLQPSWLTADLFWAGLGVPETPFNDDDRRTIGAALQLALMTAEAEIAAGSGDGSLEVLHRKMAAERLARRFKDLIARLAQPTAAGEPFKTWIIEDPGAASD
jgi:hypothetical protein